MNAKHPDTFSPKVLSLPKNLYETMVQAMKLPYKSIETTAVVGPFFWCAYNEDDSDPHLRMWLSFFPYSRLASFSAIILFNPFPS